MEDNTFRFWDVVIKALGFIATSISIYLGLTQFSRQQYTAMKFDFDRKHLDSQTQTYEAICRDAGAMIANIDSPTSFIQSKKDFLILYYGESTLVDDTAVAAVLREVKSYSDIVDPKLPGTVTTFKSLVIELASSCQRSSDNFKNRYLEKASY
jgi:hypothetical protein